MTEKPRFQLQNGDAVAIMKLMPDACVDMICTDVAYESLEKHRAKGTTTRLKVSDASSNEWFQIFKNERFAEFFTEAFRVLKPNSHLYFFCDGETSRVAVPAGEAAKFKFWNEIVWVKTKGNVSVDTLDGAVKIGMGYHYRRSKEYILFFERGKRKLNNLGIADVLPFPPVMNGYPTEKPVGLIKILIEQSTDPGAVIFDPFMGSGSAGSAAMRTGRSFIGNDIKPSAVDHARTKLVGAGGVEQQIVLIPEQSLRDQLIQTLGLTPGAQPENKRCPSCEQGRGCLFEVACPPDPTVKFDSSGAVAMFEQSRASIQRANEAVLGQSHKVEPEPEPEINLDDLI